MRRIVVWSLLAGAGALAGLGPALGQSGVISGPPQTFPGPGGPNLGPNVGPPGPDMRGGGAWVAVAGGFDDKGKNVGVGFSGVRYSRMDAENAAMSACNARGRGIRCREAFAVTTGCIYIVPGGSNRGVTWGRGVTQALALDECRRNGYTCDRGKVVGGCVTGYGN